MIADESLVTLNGLKKYDQKKGTAVIEAQELPASPLNKVYNIDDDVYSKDIRLATYQQMLDEVDKVKVDGNTQDANRNIISKAVIEQANVPLTPLDKVYNISNAASVRVFSKSTELATKEYADKFIPLTQKAAANGVATLDANGHVPVEQMPTQSLIFKGYWDASTGAFPAAGTVSGDFYIVSVEGTIGSTIYRPGDWIIWDGSAWTLSRNTNAVASVNGQTGAVTLDGSNIQATYEGTTDTINTLLTQVGKVKTVNSQTPDANGNILLDGSNINATYEGTTASINTLLTQVGKVKKVNNQTPDVNGNIQVDGSNVNATYEGTTDTINNLLTQVGKVKTVNSQTPDANGNILLDGSNIQATYEGTTDTINTLLTQVGSSDIFTGTQAEWDALSAAEKNEYSQANITDTSSTVFIPVDTVADGNMNPVTSNAVYEALPTFEQYVILLTYTVAAGAVVEIETTIDWFNDIIVIPRWLGSTEVMLANYYESNNKVKLALRNISSSTVTITNLDCYFSVIRSKINWS